MVLLLFAAVFRIYNLCVIYICEYDSNNSRCIYFILDNVLMIGFRFDLRMLPTVRNKYSRMEDSIPKHAQPDHH